MKIEKKRGNQQINKLPRKFKIIWVIVLGIVLLVGGIFGHMLWMIKKEVKMSKEIVKPKEEEAKIQLTIESLKNADYYCQSYDMKIQLNNGRYIKEYPDTASMLNIGIFNDMAAFGDLNDDEKKDAVVILDSSAGGSGHFYELAVMMDKGEKPFYLTSEKLGDRVIINSIAIQSKRIILDMVTYGPNDALCCPTLEKVIGYELSGNQLIQINEEEPTIAISIEK